MKILNKVSGFFILVFAVVFLWMIAHSFMLLREGDTPYSQIFADALTGFLGIVVIFAVPLLNSKIHNHFVNVVIALMHFCLMVLLLIGSNILKEDSLFMLRFGDFLHEYRRFIAGVPFLGASGLLLNEFLKVMAKKRRCNIPVTAYCTKVELKDSGYVSNASGGQYYDCSYKFTYGACEYELEDAWTLYPKVRFGCVYFPKPKLGHSRKFGICINGNELEYYDMGEKDNAGEISLRVYSIGSAIFLVGAILLFVLF